MLADSPALEYDSKNFPNFDQPPYPPHTSNISQSQSVDKQSLLSQVHPRIKFLRKLYFLLFLQLFACGVCTVLVYLLPELQEDIVQIPSYLILIPLFCAILMLFLIFFQRKLVSKRPLNVLVFIVFTCFLAFSFAWLVALDQTLIILMFLVNACAIALALFFYVLTTKTELTYQTASLFIVAAIFTVFQLFILFTQAEMIYLICGLILNVVFGFYLIYDTQTNISGTKHEWAKDDAYSGAALVYIDILVLVLRLCELVRQLIIRERN